MKTTMNSNEPVTPDRYSVRSFATLGLVSVALLLLAGCQSQQATSASQPADWTAHPQPEYVQGSGWYLGQSGYGPVYYGPEGHYEIYGPPPPAFPLPPAPTSPQLNPPPH